MVIDVYNDSNIPELVHWHWLFVPAEVDGAEEEGTPMVAPHSRRRYRFVPRPAGTRWSHSHISAKDDLRRATYTGQYGFLIIEGKATRDDTIGKSCWLFMAGSLPHASELWRPTYESGGPRR